MKKVSVLLIIAVCSCAEDGPDKQAGAAALDQFELAHVDEPTDDVLRERFHPAPGADGRAALLDALGTLVAATELQVVEILQPEGPGDAFVDLTARLPGDAVARYNVRLHVVQPGSWRVSWFQGPGVEWPPRRAGRGAGLSSSAPPETPR